MLSGDSWTLQPEIVMNDSSPQILKCFFHFHCYLKAKRKIPKCSEIGFSELRLYLSSNLVRPVYVICLRHGCVSIQVEIWRCHPVLDLPGLLLTNTGDDCQAFGVQEVEFERGKEPTENSDDEHKPCEALLARKV